MPTKYYENYEAFKNRPESERHFNGSDRHNPLDALNNCVGCWKCVACKNCFNCVECQGCDDCSGCVGCQWCMACTNSVGCWSSFNCYSCTECIGLRNRSNSVKKYGKYKKVKS